MNPHLTQTGNGRFGRHERGVEGQKKLYKELGWVTSAHIGSSFTTICPLTSGNS